MNRQVGTISVLDFETLTHHRGGKFLPYPFRYLEPLPYVYEHELDRYRSQFLEKYNDGELRSLEPWLDVQLWEHEIRVECLNVTKNDSSLAISATRRHDLGFIATQGDSDVISVRQVSPYELGAEVAKLAGLAGRPGPHPRVTVPSVGVHERMAAKTAGEAHVLDRVRPDIPPVVIPPEDLLAGGEVQTHHRPASRWGRDRTKPFIGWIASRQGDYLVRDPYESAVPATRKSLAETIDRLIAADVAEIRMRREG